MGGFTKRRRGNLILYSARVKSEQFHLGLKGVVFSLRDP